ncbi:LysR family transcriptional regulator [Gordonia sp. NPDC127522]|uniref:LysR family transcriptional regulator n=1 Tax=Gordonia sp. NPDC127522 TaxID=3345390 RepID=UPI00362E453E
MLNVTLRDLEYVIAVESERNFTRAATLAHIAQPALSQAIRRIEGQLGVQLFERTSRQVTPTPAGHLLAADGRRMLREMNATVEAVKQLGTQNPKSIRVHVSEPSLQVPRRALIALRNAFPDTTIEQTTLPQTQVLDQLRSGALTLAIGEAYRDPAIRTTPLTEESVVALLHHTHPLATRATVNPEDLASYPLASIDSTLSGWDRLVERFLAPTRPNWSRSKAFGAASAADLVDDTQTVLICLESIAHDHHARHRTSRSLTPPLSARWYVSWRPQIAGRATLDTLRATFARLDDGPTLAGSDSNRAIPGCERR